MKKLIDVAISHPRFTICVLLLLVHSILWLSTGYLPVFINDYNSYALQADSWLHGRLDVDYFDLLELAFYNGKYYVSFPPIPSVILLPFVLVFGASAPDHFFSFIAGTIGALCAFQIGKQMRYSNAVSLFWALFVTCASNLISLTMLGWVWFIAQSFAFGFTMLAFTCALSKKESIMGLSLFFLACAVGCRPLNVLFYPVLFYLLWCNLDKPRLRNILRLWYWLIAPGTVAILLCLLNYVRFGSITEFGHNYLPEFVQAPLGQFNLSYIPHNLYRAIRLFADNYSIPVRDGWAFYLVMPIWIAAIIIPIFIKKKPDTLVVMIIATCILHLLLTCAHKTMGGWHFGCRYLVDATPLALLLCLHLRSEKPFLKIDAVLFIIGFLINMIGTIWFYSQFV
ncbi:MAG: hypothetical protein K6F45_07390 [Saccharofermentans sp.]|nr:hypothetical protein [Saccharofermentans sp.]